MPDDKPDPTERIVGDNAAPAACHDHISAVTFIASMIGVLVFAIMYSTSPDLEMPEFLSLGGNTTVSDEVHLGLTVAGLSFAGVLGLIILFLGMLLDFDETSPLFAQRAATSWHAHERGLGRRQRQSLELELRVARMSSLAWWPRPPPKKEKVRAHPPPPPRQGGRGAVHVP